MNGYAFCLGECLICKETFYFNPMKVPSSSAVTGKREPICRICMDHLNTIRREKGLEPFTIHPEAYDACPEEELSYD